MDNNQQKRASAIDMANFIDTFEAVQKECYRIAQGKGWWDEPREDGTLIALIHAEASEALEYLRHGNPPSDHIQQYSGVEEEFADIVIRIMDMSERHGWEIGKAIISKIIFNEGREYKHGGKQF